MAKGTQNGTSGDLNKYTLPLLYFFVGIIDFEAGESYYDCDQPYYYSFVFLVFSKYLV